MIEILTVREMGEADRLTVDGGTPGIVLMERAGQAVADAAANSLVASGRVTVVAGPGNNGGDGFVTARLLAERGYKVRVLLFGERARLSGDAAEAAKRWTGETVPADPSGLANPGLIIDALFGAGLARPVEGATRALVEAMNASGARILAVDLPSGISGDSGQVLGAAVNATETVTFFRRKPGHLLLPGRLHCGTVIVADIGIPASVLERIKPMTFVNAPELWGPTFQIPRLDGHKYARGHAVVVSGSLTHSGAARLAARGALRAGAGLVTIASPREALAVNAAATLAIMVRAADGARELDALLQDRRLNAVLLGPGGGIGEGTRAQVLTALAGHRAVVLDADALTSFADEPQPLFSAIRARGAASTVLTPHDGEFARLFKLYPDIVDVPSKLEKVIAAARTSGAVVLLKGADSVVAAPDGRAAIAENAPPWLATAGSGDVLAGMIAGLLAQGMPTFEAACAGVWLHGEAANEHGPGLISEDLPEVLPAVLRRVISQFGTSNVDPSP
jgi:hydroxyethylthiazole kinase-like uncharacterized protein yjeF